MATDLASLVIGLRADVATLQSDLGKAGALNRQYAKSAADDWNSAAADIGKALGTAVVAAAGIGAAIAKQAIDAADGLNKMSQKIGVSVEALSALSVQAKLSDVGVDQLQGGLAKLARNAADAASGSKQQAAAFQALGVTLKDANGNLRSTEDLLGDVAERFASYGDSAAKTALAQQVFGKSGAELIPLLNQLGTEGFAKAREEAEKYGAVISGDTAAASERFNDNLTRLKLETQGFANAVVAQLLPSLNKLTDNMVSAGETTNRYGDSASTLVNILKGVTFAFLALGESIRAVVNIAAASGDTLLEILSLPAKAGAALANGGLDAAKKSIADSLGGIRNAWLSASIGVGDAIKGIKTDFNDLFGTFSNVASGSKTTATAVGSLTAPLLANAAASEAAAKASQDFADAQTAAGQFLSKLQGGLDPLNKAYQDYVKNVLDANKISQQLITTGAAAGHATEAYAQAQEFMAKAVGIANVSLDEQLAKLDAQGDVLGRMRQEFADQSALIGLTEREKFITEAVQKATDEWNKNTAAHIANKQSLDEVKAGTESAAAGVYDLTQKAKASQEAAQQFASIWSSAGNSIADAFAKAVVEGGSFLKSLADIAKQVVEQIISYFAKLAVINPILNSLFGGSMTGAGGGGLLPTLASSFLGSGGGATTDASGNTVFGTAQGGTSLFTAGKTMWSGFQSGYQSFFQGDSAFTMGPPDASGATSSYYGGGYQSGFGQALGIAGGVYAGYNRYQQSGGGAGGLAGAAAYGYGTYVGGAAVATVAATGSLSAGLAAIPVVGWIALAAMAVDYLSGGKLFGTKGKFNFGEQAATIGAAGATVTAGYDVKGQKAFFGGSTHSWKDLPAAQEAIDAWNQFFEQLKSGINNFAKGLDKTAGDIIGGTFIQKFDKHGNIIGNTSTVLGKTYNEDAQHFQERLVAENELAVLGQFDSKLGAAIDKYRADAEQLYAITNDLATAQTGFNDGLTLLALGSDQSTSALLALAETAGNFGESVDQTLQRILQAQGQYDQFVSQFKPATNYVDDFEGALAGIRNQLLANIKQANALAVAAGASGAAEKDLANIHEYAAQQAAAAIKALESSAQSLAFSLGLTNVGGNLDEVNSEISALQSKANTGSSAIHGFGNAINDAAQKATEAMNLLLGDLSPLNDQQKLQTALAGLRAGSATQDQVLQIGRRLYGSSQPYNDLFNMVRTMGGSIAAAAGGNASGVSHGGLSSAEQARLADLLKQQQTLQAAQQLQQYQTLAQQIAEIASAKGEDWRQVVTDMGINIADFEAGLKLTDQGTNDLIKHQQDVLDSNNENTKSIIDAINDMSDAVVTTLGGTPGAHSQHASDPSDTGSSTNPRGGHSARGTAYQTGQDIYRGFRDGMTSSQPRSGRARARA